MHLREQTRLVLPKACACFWTAITFLSDGAPVPRVLSWPFIYVLSIARIFEDDEFALPFTSEQLDRIIEVYEDLYGDIPCGHHPPPVTDSPWFRYLLD